MIAFVLIGEWGSLSLFRFINDGTRPTHLFIQRIEGKGVVSEEPDPWDPAKCLLNLGLTIFVQKT